MTAYERLYYTLCQPAFTRGKLAKNQSDHRVYLAAKYFLIVWHSIYGALVASALYRLSSGKSAPGLVFLVGVIIGLLALAYWAPSEARLHQLHKLINQRSRSEWRRFVEMLAIYGLFLASLATGYALLFGEMSL